MYIIIECFDQNNPNIVVNEDGSTLFFDTLEDARLYGRLNLHDPIIVEV